MASPSSTLRLLRARPNELGFRGPNRLPSRYSTKSVLAIARIGVPLGKKATNLMLTNLIYPSKERNFPQPKTHRGGALSGPSGVGGGAPSAWALAFWIIVLK